MIIIYLNCCNSRLCSLNYNNHIMYIYKQIKPFFNVLQFTVIFLTREIVIKTFSSVLYVLDCSFDNAFFRGGIKVVFYFQSPTFLLFFQLGIVQMWNPQQLENFLLIFLQYLVVILYLFKIRVVQFNFTCIALISKQMYGF